MKQQSELWEEVGLACICLFFSSIPNLFILIDPKARLQVSTAGIENARETVFLDTERKKKPETEPKGEACC